jgi:hypothetical protein
MSEESGKKVEVLHRDHFMNGELTPQEAHRKLAWGGKGCDKCGQPAAIRVRVFAEAAEVMKRSPQFIMQLAAANNGAVPMVTFKYGKFVRVSEAFGCDHCKSDLEREAAKAPSWCVVEIDRGPEDKLQVAVGG